MIAYLPYVIGNANIYLDMIHCEGRVSYAKTEREWAERAARHIKAELKKTDLTYEDLAEKMQKHGFRETWSSVASKLSRATLPAHIFLAALVATGKEQVVLGDI